MISDFLYMIAWLIKWIAIGALLAIGASMIL